MKFYKKPLSFLLLLSMLMSSFTLALSNPSPISTEQQKQTGEKIPISELMAQDVLSMSSVAKCSNREEVPTGSKCVTTSDIFSLFSRYNLRNSEDDTSYTLLSFNTQQFRVGANSSTSVAGGNGSYKGSGTVLYCSNDSILILTAKHNLLESYINNNIVLTDVTTDMRLIRDDNIPRGTIAAVKLADMIPGNYAFVGDKDIALVAMKLNSSGDGIFVKNRATYKMLNIRDIYNNSGSANQFDIELNHYPSHLTFYVKNKGKAYYSRYAENRYIGVHHIPTLPGSSGAAVFYKDENIHEDKKIIGVHTGSNSFANNPAIIGGNAVYYGSSNIITIDNSFELITLDELKQVVNNSRHDENILINLIKAYIMAVDENYTCDSATGICITTP